MNDTPEFNENAYSMPLSWIRMYHNVQTDNYPTHWHTAMEIIMPYVNDYTIKIGDVTTTIHVGDVFIIPPGALHTLLAPPEGERLIMLFDYSLFSNLQGINSLLGSLHPFKYISHVEYPQISNVLSDCLKEIEYEFFHDNVYKDASLYYMLVKFLVTLGRADLEIKTPFPNLPKEKQHEYVNKFMALCTYIDEQFTKDLSAEKLSEMIGLSKASFSKYFENFTGQTFQDYLNHKRISYAEKLLIYPNVSTTEVATQCGYKSLSTFNRAFRSIKNCSPTDYRSLEIPDGAN